MLLMKKNKVKKAKSKSKKQRTFTSSEFSILEDQRQLSIHQLFRNDAFKKRQPPSVLAAVPVKKNKSHKYLQTTKKQHKSKSKIRLDKCQTYEVIPYKNSLNSEIVFSNEDTRREGSIRDSSQEQIAIKVNHQYLIDNNRQLRINIKKQYQKKVEAALKIQKVFRGFLTRKVLQNCLEKQHKKLQDKLVQIRSESISQHSSYFAQKQGFENKKKVIPEQRSVFQYSNHQNNEEEEEEEDDRDSEQSSEQMGEKIIYRHHEPIYSQEQISGYLESSEQEDFDQDAFDNHIIFQTNQEYIDSRKSSLQQHQPKNKLSKTSHPDPIVEEPPETPSNHQNLDESLLTKTEKKPDRQRGKFKLQQEQEVRNQTLKLNEDISKSHSNIHQFLQNSQYEATIKENEMMKMSRKYELSAQQLSKLKEQEAKRWSQIIDLVQFQIIKPNINNSEVSNLMKQIMELSLKNKEMLQINNSLKPSGSESSLYSEKSLPRMDSRGKIKNIRSQRQYLTNMEFCINEELEEEQLAPYQEVKQRKAQNKQKVSEKRRENIILSQKASFFSSANEQESKAHEQKSNIAVNPASPLSSFENTDQLKRFLSGNIQDQYIEEMLKLREQLMKKREIQDMKQLNYDLQNRKIQQGQFINRLDYINQKYLEEKANIQKSKEDINRGHRAALKLAKEAACDAKKFGYKLLISRSVQGLKFKSPILLNDIIIDELVERKQERIKKYNHTFTAMKEPEESIHIQIGSQEESSDLQFTEEELKRFRRAQPYDIDIAEEIADLGRNVMITEELMRQQKAEDETLVLIPHLNRQIYEIEQMSPRVANNPQAELISQWLFQNILWEVSGQFMIKPLFSQRLIDKSHFSKPKSVTDKERLRFIELLQNNFPNSQFLNNKLNQKICPLPSQLLKCMRIDFSQGEEEDSSYDQIGKYEFIIGQDTCNEAIKKFRQQIDEEYPTLAPSLQQIDEIEHQYVLNEKLSRYLQQREKYICNRKNHTKELRWEVLNIEIHCIFDAWNEELIYLRSQKAGYSGIGLNELTLSVKDHNSLVQVQETISMIGEGKARLIKNMSLSSPSLIYPLLAQQDENEILENDSKWIFYADEALSYGLQLVYLIEQQIFSEIAKQLRKKMLKFY